MSAHEIKRAVTDYPLIDSIINRWSPVVFSNKPIVHEDLMTVLEAARWAPSSRNEQPWRFLYGFNGDDIFKKIYDTLMEGNRIWAKNAAVLIAVFAEKFYSHNQKPNKHYFYDTGAACAILQIQAISMGIYSHTMGGFSPKKLVEYFSIPENLDSATVIAMGYPGDPGSASKELAERDLTKRTRKDLHKIILNK